MRTLESYQNDRMLDKYQANNDMKFATIIELDVSQREVSLELDPSLSDTVRTFCPCLIMYAVLLREKSKGLLPSFIHLPLSKSKLC